MTNLRTIAASLLEGGMVALDLTEPRALPDHEQPEDEIVGRLEAVDAAAREEAPGEAPPFDRRAAYWGLARLHDLARLLVDREETDESVIVHLTRAVDLTPDRTAPDAIWSVDLALRHVPSLSRLALAFVRDDPVVLEIERLAGEWPLSGVGRRAVDPVILEAVVPEAPPFIETVPVLSRLYRDRVDAAAHASNP